MSVVRTLAFLALGAASTASLAAAPVLEVSKSVTIAAPAAMVWAKAKDFNALDTWHPAVAKDEIVTGTNNVPGAERLLTLGDGGTIREKLVSFDDKGRSFKYAIVEGVLPVSDYTSTFTVTPAGKSASTVTWAGSFKRKDTGDMPAETANDATATTAISGVYQGGLDNLKTLVEAK